MPGYTHNTGYPTQLPAASTNSFNMLAARSVLIVPSSSLFLFVPMPRAAAAARILLLLARILIMERK